MKESIMIVMAAIVVLVIALVLLTIFGQGITGPSDFASKKSICLQQLTGSCKITGDLPSGWNSVKYTITENGVRSDKTCQQLTSISSCAGL